MNAGGGGRRFGMIHKEQKLKRNILENKILMGEVRTVHFCLLN